MSDRIPRNTIVRVTKGGVSRMGRILTLNRSGSYGIRLSTSGRIIEADAVEVTPVAPADFGRRG